MRSRRWLAVLIAVVLVLVAGVMLRRRRGEGAAVDLEPAQLRAQFRSHVTASGEIVATRYADVGSSVMGRIVELPVAEGDRVTAGQILARLDPVQARASAVGADALVEAQMAEAGAAREQLRAARADLDAARARATEAARNLERTTGLAAEGVASASSLDATRAAAEAAAAAVAAASAAVDRAEQSAAAASRRAALARSQATIAGDVLGKTAIAAPLSGVVTRLLVREGEMVVVGIQNQPGTTLLTISDLSAIDAEVKVAEADILRVAVGQPAEVTLEAVPGRILAGEVTEVGASALPVTGPGAAAREFRVVIRLAEADPGLRPGLTCDAQIRTAEKAQAVTIPLQSVVLRSANDSSERTGVFTARDGRATFVAVEPGIIGGLDIEVSGIEAGVEVVAGPVQVLRELQDGDRVRVARSRRAGRN